jgi:hypothetical protein
MGTKMLMPKRRSTKKQDVPGRTRKAWLSVAHIFSQTKLVLLVLHLGKLTL